LYAGIRNKTEDSLMARKELKRKQTVSQGIVDAEVSENGNIMKRVMGSKLFLVGIQLSILFVGLMAKGVIQNFFGS